MGSSPIRSTRERLIVSRAKLRSAYGVGRITVKHRNYQQLAITASVWKNTGLDTQVA